MSGHSKWSTIRRHKAIVDAKKGAEFTKLSKQISHAARMGGDPNMNFMLRMAIQKAREANMSGENIDRAVKKGTGEDKDSNRIESVEYEAMVGGNISMLIDTLTDNRNRTVAELRTILERNGGRLVNEGAVNWQFEVKGVIKIPFDSAYSSDTKKWNNQDLTKPVQNVDDFMLSIIDIDGVEDIQVEDGFVHIYTTFDKLDSVRKGLEDLNYKIASFELIKTPKSAMEVSSEDQEKLGKLMDLLEENEDVSNIWVNI